MTIYFITMIAYKSKMKELLLKIHANMTCNYFEFAFIYKNVFLDFLIR